MDGGAEPIRDAAERSAVRRQGVRVRWLTVAAATLLTTLYVLFSNPGTLR